MTSAQNDQPTSSKRREAVIHFLSGAVGGTAGTSLTCPLEVVKTRMQSSEGLKISPTHVHSNDQPSTSKATLHVDAKHENLFDDKQQLSKNRSTIVPQRTIYSRFAQAVTTNRRLLPSLDGSALWQQSARLRHSEEVRLPTLLYRYFKHIVATEGFSALFKGLGPNVVGVAPSKAVYFATYQTVKQMLNGRLNPDTPLVHMCSAGTAGMVSATFANPIWLIKTRLQLSKSRRTIMEVIRSVYRKDGWKGFYRGVTASYVGVSETIVQFVVYEQLRAMTIEYLDEQRRKYDDADCDDDERPPLWLRNPNANFVLFMACGGTSKLFATTLAYPHEVARTRLREEGTKYRTFVQTVYVVYMEEGARALYRGLSVHLLRTVPNTAITMGTYEIAVYIFRKLSGGSP